MADKRSKSLLITVFGLPGAGKSFLCKAIQDAILTKSSLSPTSASTIPTVITVSYDVLIPQIQPLLWKGQRRTVLSALSLIYRKSTDEKTTLDDESTEEATKMAETILQLNGLSFHSTAFRRPFVFLLDDNFYYRSMRYEVYQLAVTLRMGFRLIFIDGNCNICRERNARRSAPVPNEIFERMTGLLERPETKYRYEENSRDFKSNWQQEELDDAIACILNDTQTPFIWSKDLEGMKDMEEVGLKWKDGTTKGVNHTADLILRGLVAERLLAAAMIADRKVAAGNKRDDVANDVATIIACKRMVFLQFKKMDVTTLDMAMDRDHLKQWLSDAFEETYQKACSIFPTKEHLGT
ncbi:putative L-seryl-tRNA(Sec) kinase [Hypsibius exemplaris]|uniref:L-seryl-tRNA(Sec) kinase n=1 Tax=Hypsibius exemplaris TaxID=2072580 RepID=A0A1W0X7K5_HYPEX|nr:putative L-seryl-tRNA(Sec) kinase [Hypsibius exemplaris]